MSLEKVRETGALYMKFFHSSGVVGERTHRNLSLEPATDLVSKDPRVSERAAKRLITLSKIALNGMSVIPEEFPYGELVKDLDRGLVRSHLAAMLPKMELFFADSKRDKALRWLGFIGGANAAMSMGRGGSHVYSCGVISTLNKDVEDGNMERAFYLLGFVQGVLWATGVYSIQELRQHNEP